MEAFYWLVALTVVKKCDKATAIVSHTNLIQLMMRR